MIRVGTAGWTLPRTEQERFPATGTHLQRYAARFSAVEINSSFYRPHRPSTYGRWAQSVPDGFLFSIKLPKTITHGQRLRDVDARLDGFLGEVAGLGDGLGCLLVQLPPSLEFDASVAEPFFSALYARSSLAIACEPRHPTWFADEAADLLARFQVARVAADPARVAAAGEPGGWPGLVYYRLHGSPRIYYSAYEPAYLDALAARLRDEAAAGRQVWCIFDNTASGAAAADALGLVARLE